MQIFKIILICLALIGPCLVKAEQAKSDAIPAPESPKSKREVAANLASKGGKSILRMASDLVNKTDDERGGSFTEALSQQATGKAFEKGLMFLATKHPAMAAAAPILQTMKKPVGDKVTGWVKGAIEKSKASSQKRKARRAARKNQTKDQQPADAKPEEKKETLLDKVKNAAGIGDSGEKENKEQKDKPDQVSTQSPVEAEKSEKSEKPQVPEETSEGEAKQAEENAKNSEDAKVEESGEKKDEQVENSEDKEAEVQNDKHDESKKDDEKEVAN